MPLDQLEKQVIHIMKAIQADPSRKREILNVYFSNFLSAVKETIGRHGHIMPLYIIVADAVELGVPPVTEEVINKAKELKAEAVVCVEGFQSDKDISDVIYHVSMSAPCVGVMGWVLKVQLGGGRVEFKREMPYHFDSPDKVKTLGELISEIE